MKKALIKWLARIVLWVINKVFGGALKLVKALNSLQNLLYVL